MKWIFQLVSDYILNPPQISSPLLIQWKASIFNDSNHLFWYKPYFSCTTIPEHELSYHASLSLKEAHPGYRDHHWPLQSEIPEEDGHGHAVSDRCLIFIGFCGPCMDLHFCIHLYSVNGLWVSEFYLHFSSILYNLCFSWFFFQYFFS